MNNKLKLVYVIFYIFSFIALFFINSLYRFITDIEPGHKYIVSAEQYYDYKGNALKKIINKTINKDYLLKNIIVTSESLTLDDLKTSIKFDLQLNEFIDESELELSINQVYIGSIKEIVEDFNSNRSLYDYAYLESLYEEQAYENKSVTQKNIQIEYNGLMSSKLFELYPPKIKCFFKSENLCLNKYKRYYRELYEALNISAIAMEMNKFKNDEGSVDLSEAPVFEILSNFEMYKGLFELNNTDVQYSFSQFKKDQYFEKKYYELLSTDFFRKYMPERFCLNYNESCFRKIGENFNIILSKHQLEMMLPFKVAYQQKSKEIGSFVSDLPLNIAFAFIATYLFFIFTNKFFKIKIK